MDDTTAAHCSRALDQLARALTRIDMTAAAYRSQPNERRRGSERALSALQATALDLAAARDAIENVAFAVRMKR
jgi:hypothetical protein